MHSSQVALSLVLSTCLSLVSCTREPLPALPEKSVLNVVYHVDAQTLDPAKAHDSVSLSVVAAIHEPLFHYHYLSDQPKILPLLAADMPEISEDGLRYVIRVRDDAKFHGTRQAVTAHDFVRAFKNLASPDVDSPAYWLLRENIAGLRELRQALLKAPTTADRAKILEKPLDGVRAKDDRTLELRLTRRFRQLLHFLTLPFTAPLAAPELVSNSGATPPGTGPFLLASWHHGKEIVLKRNPNYHAGFYPIDATEALKSKGLLLDAGKTLPFIDELRFHVVAETEEARKGLESGLYDIIPGREPMAGSHEHRERTINHSFLCLNMQDPILGKQAGVRQAISSAIDRSEWIRIVGDGAQKASSIRYDYDPARAAELLKKSGFKGEKKLPPLELDVGRSGQQNLRLAEMVEKQLGAIGIQTRRRLHPLDEPAHISLCSWSADYPDPSSLFHLLYGPNRTSGSEGVGANRTGFAHSGFDIWFKKLVEDPNFPETSARKLGEIIQEEVPWVLGIEKSDSFLVKSWVRNYEAVQWPVDRWRYLRIDSEMRRAASPP